MQTIPKTYEPKKAEDRLYKKWESSGLFKPSFVRPGRTTEGLRPFSIAMPPPNATGTLHLGHAVMLALEDIMARHARMSGRPTLWLPGTDHASIATENKVEKELLEKKKKTKQELGREKFLKEVEAFVADSQSTIKNQIRKMGASCDWSHERYTLDEGLSRCVSEVFVKMHNDGLIYRGHRIVNWCTRCQSTLADDEVEYKEQYGKFYYLKYGPVTIGTARPETKVLDKIIIVHPNDKRYKKWVGKTLDVPWIDGTVKAAFVADKAADMEFGSGAMTITPAHSFVDFDLAQKHGFEIKQIISPQGKLTKNGGAFAGMPVREAREAIVKALQKKGLVEKIDENYVHNLSVCYRCETPVEPLVSKQWFVDVDKKIPARKKSLKELAIHAVKSGDIEIIPDRFNKTYFQWMENLHDWCISRQIWFGHRIPVWYCESVIGNRLSEIGCEPIVSVEKPKRCPKCKGTSFKQDPDTLDTWFSSALWTFSTLLDKPKKNDTLDSWIERNRKKGADLATFHPTSVMETGYDILFFWVARMVLMTTYVMGEVPFKTVYLHGLVRDQQGRKMSKSLGNGIDPLDMIAQYGADATRLSLVIGATPGGDSRLYEEKIAGYRNFVNKIWNVARFILMSRPHPEPPLTPPLVKGENKSNRRGTYSSSPLLRGRLGGGSLADQWIESRLQNLIADVDRHFEQFEFSAAGEKIYNFLWHELADWYVEIAKQQNHSIAPQMLLAAIKLLHPFTPFVTEEIYQRLKSQRMVDAKDAFLATSSWPAPNARARNRAVEMDFAALQALITTLRDLRATYNLSYSEKLDAAITTKKYKNLFQEEELVVERLTKIRIQVLPSKPANTEGLIRAHTAAFDVYVKLGAKGLREQETRLAREREHLAQYIATLERKLSNKQFTKNAPAPIVAGERKKLEEAKQKLQKL